MEATVASAVQATKRTVAVAAMAVAVAAATRSKSAAADLGFLHPAMPQAGSAIVAADLADPLVLVVQHCWG